LWAERNKIPAQQQALSLHAIKMTHLRPIIIIAVFANLLTFMLYNYAASEPGGTGLGLAFIVLWMPVVWLTSIIATSIITIRKRNSLFEKPILAWTLLTLLFTTPVPAIASYILTHPIPETRSDGMETNTIDGKVYKTEFWIRTATHNKFVDKRFIADSSQEAMFGDKAYKKDSDWVYFDDYGDTLKIEHYKNDSLISTKQIKQ
jgi:hypothetical protein